MTVNPKNITCDFSNPNFYNRKYIPLFDNKSRFLHLFGSAGSGKSVFAAQKEIVLSFAWHRRNRKTLVVRQFHSTIKDSIYAELVGVINDWNLDKYFRVLVSPLTIINKITNVVFVFKGMDDNQKLKSIKGVDRVLVEEATELNSEEDLKQLDMRVRGFEDGQITLAYNPIDEFNWLNTEIHQAAKLDHFIFHSTYKDNEKMLAKDPDYERRVESYDKDSNFYRVYVAGLWGKVVEGLIYSQYDLIDEFPKNEKGEDDIHFYGLDFGFSDPCALVAQHVQDASPKKKLINKEILYEPDLDGVGLVAEFDKLGVRKDVKIIADCARPEMIKSLKDAGYKVIACEKFAGSVLSGINRIRKYQIVIVRGSKNMIKEINNYVKGQINGVWVEEPAPRQVDHCLDASRYGEQATGIVDPKPKKSTSRQTYW